jgi:hypothetical protein
MEEVGWAKARGSALVGYEAPPRLCHAVVTARNERQRRAQVHFQTGDMVRAEVPTGKSRIGCVAVAAAL